MPTSSSTDLAAHIGDRLAHFFLVHQLDALLENDLALVIHHVVIFEDVLAHLEIARLDLLLGLFQRTVDPGMDDRLALLEAQAAQHAVHPFRAENAHQIVFERQEEFAVARVALAAGPAAQLIVDAPGFMPLRADHIEAAGLKRRSFFSAISARMILRCAAICASSGVLPFSCSAASQFFTRISRLPPS